MKQVSLAKLGGNCSKKTFSESRLQSKNIVPLTSKYTVLQSAFGKPAVDFSRGARSFCEHVWYLIKDIFTPLKAYQNMTT